jgi:DNA polymerase-3 subunit beta
MQLVKTHRDTLLRPLQIVSGIVERRHTLPILANILIRKDGEQVSFLSTDIEVQITTKAEIGSGGENVATTVAARKLLDILRALPDDNDVVLKLDNKRMSVQSGKSCFVANAGSRRISTVAQAEHFNASVNLPQKTLKHLFNMVHFSMAQQDIRYYLNGLLLVVDGKNVIAVATDGHRLAYCQVEVEQEFPATKSSFRAKLSLIAAPLEDKDDPVQIDIANNQVKLTFADIELISKLVEGKFPDFNRVIPKGYKNNFTLGREQLLRSATRSDHDQRQV